MLDGREFHSHGAEQQKVFWRDLKVSSWIVVYPLLDWKPVKLNEEWFNVVHGFGADEDPSSRLVFFMKNIDLIMFFIKHGF